MRSKLLCAGMLVCAFAGVRAESLLATQFGVAAQGTTTGEVQGTSNYTLEGYEYVNLLSLSSGGNSATCDECVLRFTTGTRISSSETNGVYTFIYGAGGSIELDGYVNGVSALDNTKSAAPVLFQGTFTQPIEVQIRTLNGSITNQWGSIGTPSGATTIGNVNPNLATAFDFSGNNPLLALLNLTFQVGRNQMPEADGFYRPLPGANLVPPKTVFYSTTTGTSGDLDIELTPEPLTFLLTGIGLVLLGLLRKELGGRG